MSASSSHIFSDSGVVGHFSLLVNGVGGRGGSKSALAAKCKKYSPRGKLLRLCTMRALTKKSDSGHMHFLLALVISTKSAGLDICATVSWCVIERGDDRQTDAHIHTHTHVSHKCTGKPCFLGSFCLEKYDLNIRCNAQMSVSETTFPDLSLGIPVLYSIRARRLPDSSLHEMFSYLISEEQPLRCQSQQ